MALKRRNPPDTVGVADTNKADDERRAEEFKEGHENPSYDTKSHKSVICQVYGSVWPTVLPWCLCNVCLTVIILLLKHNLGIDLSFPSQGHTFMSGVLAFLLVSRASIAYKRFMEASEELENLFRCSKELVHYMCVFSMHEQGPQAKEWRLEVAYRTILLLRLTMAALEHPSSKKNTWEVPELGIEEKRDVRENLALDVSSPSRSPSRRKKSHRRGRSVMVSNVVRWAHGPRSLRDENFRAPIVMTLKLRTSIVSHKNNRLEQRLHVNQEREMLMFVSQYLTAYEGLRKLITTPYPFPLVQMARWFLLFWVFTIPFPLVHDVDTAQVLAIVFFITFGFMGLEVVSTELDDPFGDDPNDFNNLGMAKLIFEDIYITINTVDGLMYAQQLRDRVMVEKKEDTPLGHYRKESCSLYRNVADTCVLMEWE